MASPLKRPRLTTKERVGGTPGMPNKGVPSRAGTPLDIQAALDKEYVSGGGQPWLSNYARTLPQAIDDITADWGVDIYDRMMLDSQVAACLSVLRSAVLEDETNLTSCVTDHSDPGYRQAADLADFCSAALGGLETPLPDVLWSMMDALAFGHRVAEQVYAYDATYTGQNRLVLRAIKLKPQGRTAFVVDGFNNVLGLMAVIPGVAQTLTGSSLLSDPNLVPNILPRSKFAVLSFRDDDGDPRGNSILRPAYDSWWQKQQLKPQFLKYLTQFASPSLVGTGPEQGLPQAQTDSYGNIVLDVNGNPIMVQPLTALGNALSTFQNGTWMTIPYGANVKAMEMSGDGNAFLQAFHRFDTEITKAILTQTLATEEGQHQARAAASVHQDVLDTLVRSLKVWVASMIQRDILTPLIRYNFGDAALRYTPRVMMGKVEERDKTARMQAYAQLAMGYPLTEAQLAQIDTQIGLVARQPGDTVLTGKTVAPAAPAGVAPAQPKLAIVK